MSNLPSHLKDILSVTERDEWSISGDIVYTCGCDSFVIKYIDTDISNDEYHKKTVCIIKAYCECCGKEWLLFDYAKHSFDSLICGCGISVPDTDLSDFISDNEHIFNISMKIDIDDEEQFAEYFLKNSPMGISYTPDDLYNVWCWVTINLRGSGSGKEINDFIDIQLA